MEIEELIEKLFDGLNIEEKYVWDYLDVPKQTKAYLVINSDVPNVFIITVECAKIEVVE